MTIQHDNAIPHSARITRNFLAGAGVNVLPWPSCSPDLNPIDHFSRTTCQNPFASTSECSSAFIGFS